MDTGLEDIAYGVYDQLDMTPLFPEDVAQKILTLGQRYAKYLTEDTHQATFYVVGLGKSSIDSFEVTISAKGQRVVPVTSKFYAEGSGAREVIPALNRDAELGIARTISTSLEAMALCFGVSNKAGSNLWVNDHLQIGVVSPHGTRMLMHPAIDGRSTVDVNAYLSLLTGIVSDIPSQDPARKLELRSVSRLAQAFYQACETVFGRYLFADTRSNESHTKLKSGTGSLEDYQKSLENLREAADNAQFFVDAFVSGSASKLADAVRRFYAAERLEFDRAEKAK